MIYFDNASTTQPEQNILDAYLELASNNFANPNSIHKLGVSNFNNINRIKKDILKTLKLNQNDYDVIFTSGATEANNLAILGFANKNKRFKHFVTSEYEHSSILNPFKHLEKLGYKVDYIKINEDGLIDLEDLKNKINNEPTFYSFMGVNNEIGSINNLVDIKKLIGNNSILFSDLVQTIGKEKIDLNYLDLFSFTSHKIYGIKGIGCLIKKKKINIENIIYGGEQENGLRPGTQDFAAISCFNLALKEVMNNHENNYKLVREINDYIVNELKDLDEIHINSSSKATPYIINVSTKNKKASVIVEALSNKEVFVSSVSACNSKKEPNSYVVYSLTKNEKYAKNTIRISLGKNNTLDEAKEFCKIFKEVLSSIRS